VKKIFILVLTFVFVASTMPIYAQAYGEVYKDTTFNRLTDWFATVGKSQEEKYRIKHERRTARMIYRAKKRINKQKRNIAK